MARHAREISSLHPLEFNLRVRFNYPRPRGFLRKKVIKRTDNQIGSLEIKIVAIGCDNHGEGLVGIISAEEALVNFIIKESIQPVQQLLAEGRRQRVQEFKKLLCWVQP